MTKGKIAFVFLRVFCPFCGINLKSQKDWDDHLLARHYVEASESQSVLAAIKSAYQVTTARLIDEQTSGSGAWSSLPDPEKILAAPPAAAGGTDAQKLPAIAGNNVEQKPAAKTTSTAAATR